MANRIITGIEDVDRKLLLLSTKQANKIATAGINAGLARITKNIRSAISSSSASREMKKALRSTVGKSFLKGGKAAKYGPTAKAGLGVGSGARRKGEHGTKYRSGIKGVGISGNNVHWAALGTRQRFVGVKTRKNRSTLTGNRRKFTGYMPSFPVVREAGKNGLSSLLKVVEERSRTKLEEILK